MPGFVVWGVNVVSLIFGGQKNSPKSKKMKNEKSLQCNFFFGPSVKKFPRCILGCTFSIVYLNPCLTKFNHYPTTTTTTRKLSINKGTIILVFTANPTKQVFITHLRGNPNIHLYVRFCHGGCRTLYIPRYFDLSVVKDTLWHSINIICRFYFENLVTLTHFLQNKIICCLWLHKI